MRKAIKIFRLIGGIIIGILLFVIAMSFLNHKIQLAKEDNIFNPNGRLFEINGHNLHIYIEGEGEDTLVFMAGGGTSSPVLDFKSLYSLLSDKYKIAVVEKAGYGFSEDSDISRDLDTILSETREMLSKAGLKPPYVLFPHSMSGIEALYWAQEYPDEVKAIVGLDMAVPEAYEEFKINHFILNLGSFASKIGITRFFPSIADDSAAIKYGTLRQEEKDLYRAVFYRKTLGRSMREEIKAIASNADKLEDDKTVNTPMLFFISNGRETGWDPARWIEFQRSYIENIKTGKAVMLDSGHYVHDIEYEKIAEESQVFIESINNF